MSDDRPISAGDRGPTGRPPAPRERVCRRLAEVLADPEGLRAVRLGQAAGLLDAAAGERPEDEAAPATETEQAPGSDPRPISIWCPETVDGATVWVRPPVGPLGDHYAATRVLQPRRGPLPRRIAWFGESAAAGYLYAPHVTPAKLLDDHLRAVTGRDGYEVIDLSRTNETLGTLVQTVERALQLEPDLLAVYAGNNWRLLETPEVSPHVPSVRSRREIAAALDAPATGDGPAQPSPWAGPAGLARKRMTERASAALDRLARLARDAGVPLLLVLPEVNLADWESRQPSPWLPNDGTARWYRLLEAAQNALEREDWDRAEEAAWAMNRLDGSACPTPFRILARAWHGAGRTEEARDAALAEVDAVHYPLMAFLDAPRAGSDARQVLAAAARRHDLPTVDLRTVLAEVSGSPLPGRRLFLDYCHLTSEGMAALAAAVAAEAVRLCPLPDRPRADRAPLPRASGAATEPPPAVEATARLGAVLHGAHRLLPLGSSGPILRHWCARALEADPGVARAMVDLAALRLALLDGVPAVLSDAFRRLQSSPYRMTLQHGLRWGSLDGDVLRAMLAALERAGLPEADTLRRLLATAADRLTRPVDLARGERFLCAPLERLFPEVMERTARDHHGRATLRAHGPVTAFDLPVSGGAPLRIRLVARLPHIQGTGDSARTGTARITLEDRPVGRCDLTEAWSGTPFDLVPGTGIERLRIHWPELPPVGTEAIAAARDALELGRDTELHPVFGEIASLVVHRAGASG